MKNLLPGVIALALVSSACLFDEPVVPGKAEPVDKRLVGEWRCLSPGDEDPAAMRIAELPQQRYSVEFQAKDEQPSRFTAQNVKLDGKVVVNLQEVKEKGDGKWLVARYDVYRPDLISLQIVSEEPFKDATTPAARVEVVRRGLKGGDVFGPFCSCIRFEPDKK